MESYSQVIKYHESTKHLYNRFAKSRGYLDWANQPNPFRFYEGAEIIKLPLLKNDLQNNYDDIYTGNPSSLELDFYNIAAFLELSMAISAWKAIDQTKWALRINPSSGNLHPTEMHLLSAGTEMFSAGIYHYNPFLHSLEKRASLPEDLFKKLETHFGGKGFLAAITSIYWREAWKYGERALRYCHHDTGHAVASIRFSANLFGWSCKYLNMLSDNTVEFILGLDKTKWPALDKEEPDLLLWIYKNKGSEPAKYIPRDILNEFTNMECCGEPNKLSKDHDNWALIYETSEKIRKPATERKEYSYSDYNTDNSRRTPGKAGNIIRKRRSATNFDREKSIMSKENFFSLLKRTLPVKGIAPFDIELSDTNIHLLIFIHSVTGVDSGLYFFIRNKDHEDELRNELKKDFTWEKVNYSLPLYILEKGNLRDLAKTVCCVQEIAGDGAFSLGMVARFDDTVKRHPFLYKHLFWEAGIIGHILYLEAEAIDLRGTGIGCYFDEEVHKIMGLQSNKFQSLYHFTVGVPLEDQRLTTLKPYSHLEKIDSRS